MAEVLPYKIIYDNDGWVNHHVYRYNDLKCIGYIITTLKLNKLLGNHRYVKTSNSFLLKTKTDI